MTLLIRLNSDSEITADRVAELVAERLAELPDVKAVMTVDVTDLGDSQTNRKDSWVDEEADVQSDPS
jgi:hypothetical protein